MRIHRLCLLALLCPLIAGADSAQRLVDEELTPLLEGRPYRLQIKRDGDQSQIRVHSKDGDTYDIILDPSVSEVPASAPTIVRPRVNSHRAEVRLPVNWDSQRDAAMGRIRGMLRADGYLHPMNTPEDIAPRATPPQLKALSELIGHQRSLLMFPPGMGKTVVAGLLAREMAIRSGKPVLAVFIVQNGDLLDDAAPKLQRLMNLSDDQVHRVYGDTSGAPLYREGARLIMASRTAAHRDMEAFSREAQSFDGEVLYIMDEAQHLGREDGEFAAILKIINRTLRTQDVLLGLSATPWHTDMGPIHSIFHDHVVMAFLSDAQVRYYLDTGKFIEAARLMLFLAMQAGYLSPISSYREVNYVENGQPIREFLRQSEVETSRLTAPDQRKVLKRDWQMHLPFIEHMISEIRSTEERIGDEVAYWNRGIIFVPSIAHAEAYAKMINKVVGRGNIRAQAYHSDLSRTQRKDALEWFDSNVHQHRYLLAIRTLGEAFDRKQVNHVILSKPYSKEDRVGMRELIQNLGRLTRIGKGKARTWISDFTGDMRRLLFEGLDESLITSFFTEGGRRELTRPARPVVFTDASTNLSRLNGEGFEGSSVIVPPRPPTSANDDVPKTLAHVILDRSLIPSLLPGMPMTSRGAQRNLGYFICQIVKRAEMNSEPGFEYGIRLAYALGFDTFNLDNSGLRKALQSHCHRAMFGTPPTGDKLDGYAAELAKIHPLLAEPSKVMTDRLGKDVSSLNIAPLLGHWGPGSAKPRRWTLAEVLLHPLLPRLLGINSPNLATLILDGGYAALPWASDWNEISWRERLRSARSYDLLSPPVTPYLYGASAAHFAIEALTTIDVDLFDQATEFTDHDLYRLARRLAIGHPARRQVEGTLLINQFNPRAVKDLNHEIPLFLSKYHSRRQPDLARWSVPWTMARTIVHPLAAELSTGHAKVVEALVHNAPRELTMIRAGARDDGRYAARIDDAERRALGALSSEFERSHFAQPLSQFSDEIAMHALARAARSYDRSVYEPLTSYLRGVGPVPARRSEAKLEKEDNQWTVARLLLDPSAVKVFFPGGLTSSGEMAPRTFGEVLCAEVWGMHSRTRDPAHRPMASVLKALGLSFRAQRVSEREQLILDACSDAAFGTIDQRADMEHDRDLLKELERRLILRAPSVFAMKTRLTDADRDVTTSSLLARAPLIPELAPKSTGHTVALRNWSLSAFLLNPFIPMFMDETATNLASEAVSATRTATWLPAARVAASYGLNEISGPADVVDAAHFKQLVRNYQVADVNQLTRTVPFSDFDLYVWGQRKLKPRTRRLLETFLISRGYDRKAFDKITRPARDLPDHYALPPRKVINVPESVEAWRQPWTLARTLLDPLTPLISNAPEDIGEEIWKAGSLAAFLLDTPKVERFLRSDAWRTFLLQWDLREIVELARRPEILASLKRLSNISFVIGDRTNQMDIESDLIRLNPAVFGARVPAFSDERIVHALRTNPAHAVDLHIHLNRLGPIPPAGDCQPDLRVRRKR